MENFEEILRKDLHQFLISMKEVDERLFDEDGSYHHLWIAMQDDPELTAVVHSRQLHIYRNGKKVLVLAGKSSPKVIGEDRICELISK